MSKALSIAIQGGQASFHDMATRQYFPENSLSLCECRSFRQLCKTLVAGEADLGVMAIENSLVGSILPNYALLHEYPLYIIGETFLHIEQNLMALPGQQISDLHSVRSHPMALQQCSDFLEKLPHIRNVESPDTAESAREIAAENLMGVGAIASRLAAERYGLELLAAGIENLKDNYTRFLVISREPAPKHHHGKASVNFHVSHEVGSLSKVLNIFFEKGLNLTLIQSLPIPGRPDEYAFHVDLEWENPERFELAIEGVKRFTKQLMILGVYNRGEKPYDYPGGKPS